MTTVSGASGERGSTSVGAHGARSHTLLDLGGAWLEAHEDDVLGVALCQAAARDVSLCSDRGRRRRQSEQADDDAGGEAEHAATAKDRGRTGESLLTFRQDCPRDH